MAAKKKLADLDPALLADADRQREALRRRHEVGVVHECTHTRFSIPWKDDKGEIHRQPWRLAFVPAYLPERKTRFRQLLAEFRKANRKYVNEHDLGEQEARLEAISCIEASLVGAEVAFSHNGEVFYANTWDDPKSLPKIQRKLVLAWLADLRDFDRDLVFEIQVAMTKAASSDVEAKEAEEQGKG